MSRLERLADRPRIAMVGLGGIAQKVYLPLLSRETGWTLAGAYSPNSSKRDAICAEYRIPSLVDLDAVIDTADAVFVHSSTASHFFVISTLLQSGRDVYVDKPLAATVAQGEELVELADRHECKLMVGFNRRFAPRYRELKADLSGAVSVLIEKHRVDGVGSPFEFTMLDDYLHLIDTARWLADGALTLMYDKVILNLERQLLFASHVFDTGAFQLSTAMHRRAGSNLEQVSVTADRRLARVANMSRLEIESDGVLRCIPVDPWETILKQKGFEDCVQHFIDCVVDDTTPSIDGQEALDSQRLVADLISRAQ